MHFNYQALPSVRAYYAAGYRFERSQRIGSVVTRVNGADVRQYMPVYGGLCVSRSAGAPAPAAALGSLAGDGVQLALEIGRLPLRVRLAHVVADTVGRPA